MWVPKKEEAVEMFARHFEACHRSGAVERAKQRLLPLEPKVITKATRFGAMSLAGSRHCERRIGLRSDGRKSGRKASVQNAQPALLRGSAFPLH